MSFSSRREVSRPSRGRAQAPAPTTRAADLHHLAAPLPPFTPLGARRLVLPPGPTAPACPPRPWLSVPVLSSHPLCGPGAVRRAPIRTLRDPTARSAHTLPRTPASLTPPLGRHQSGPRVHARRPRPLRPSGSAGARRGRPGRGRGQGRRAGKRAPRALRSSLEGRAVRRARRHSRRAPAAPRPWSPSVAPRPPRSWTTPGARDSGTDPGGPYGPPRPAQRP